MESVRTSIELVFSDSGNEGWDLRISGVYLGLLRCRMLTGVVYQIA